MKLFKRYSFEFPWINVNGPEVFSKEIKAEFSVYKELVAKQT